MKLNIYHMDVSYNINMIHIKNNHFILFLYYLKYINFYKIYNLNVI